MSEPIDLTTSSMLVRLLIAGLVGGLIGYERRLHHKVIGVAGMMLAMIDRKLRNLQSSLIVYSLRAILWPQLLHRARD